MVTKEFRLMKNSIGRYEPVDGDHEYTSGDPMEALVGGNWVKGRVEYSHDIGDYFLELNDSAVFLRAGMKVRLNR